MPPFSFITNPFFSSSAEPNHALRYSYGLKPDKLTGQYICTPEYDRAGIPKNKYLGKFFIFLFEKVDGQQHRLVDLLEKYNKGDLGIKPLIIHEREVSAAGGLDCSLGIYETPICVPSLDAYYSSYKEEFGLDENNFRLRKEEVLKGDTKQLLHDIVKHLTTTMIGIAKKAAEDRGGLLRYRIDENTLAAEPAKKTQKRRR